MSIQGTTLLQTGMIIPYLGGANSTPPDGWLYCDGTEKTKQQYPDLYSLIGNPSGAGSYGTATDLANKFVLPGSMRLLNGFSSVGIGVYSSSHDHGNTSLNISANLASTNHSHNMNAPASIAEGGSAHDHLPASGYNANVFNSSAPAANTGQNANVLLNAGNANLLADDAHSHALLTYLPSANYNHTHNSSAGTINTTNTHDHSLTGAVNVSSSAPTNTDYPPYILVWHIIKT